MNSMISTPDRISEIASSPEALGVRANQVRTQFAPAFENIDYGLSQAQNEAQLANSQLDLQRNQLQQSIEDAIKQVKRNQADQQSQFVNQQQRLGIRQSGLTDTGLAQMGADTTNQLNRLELNRANQLASLALQGSGVQNSLASAIRQAQLQRNTLSQDIQNQISGFNQQDFGNEVNKFQLGQNLPIGQRGFLGRFGYVEGQRRPDAGDFGGLESCFFGGGSDEEAYQQYLQSQGGY